PLPLHDALPILIGEFARTPRYQGGGSSHMVPTRVSSALEAFEEVSGEFPVRFAPGFTLDGTEAPELVDEAVTLAADAHTTVLFLVLPEAWESDGCDRTDITLPAAQRELLARVRRVSSRVVVVLSNGGVVSVADWQDDTDAVLEGWLLGQEGGAATVDVLTGAVGP